MLPTGRKNTQLVTLRQQFHQSLQRYDTAYKQSTKSFLTETIATKDEARDKITKIIEWVARYWAEHPYADDALHGRRIYQVFAQATQAADLQAMGLTQLVQQASTLTTEIEQLMQQRQEDSAGYIKGEMRAARDENEQLLGQVLQFVNALLIVSPDQALEQMAGYIQQDLSKTEAQYQQSRKHGKKDDGGDDGDDVTPVEPEQPEAPAEA